MKLYYLVFQGLLTVVIASQQRPKQAKPNTSWEELRNVLSSPDILNLPTVQIWKEQCLDPMIFKKDSESVNPFSEPFYLFGYDIGFRPAGVCMIHMSCMFEGCIFYLGTDVAENCPEGEICMEFNRMLEPPFDPSVLDEYEDTMELPAAVLHPKTLSDVVRGVEFAKEHDIGVSVKVVGHSYFGSSTNRGTLLIKMSDYYPQYALEGSLTECSTITTIDTDPTDASNMACNVATTRGKKAYIRVGGGELFDTAYRAVFFDWNNNPANTNKYHFVGGYCGTVSAAGGWVQSGGLSGTSMRLYGLGIDQVIHIEMVLPDGTHVRFGPSDWEEQEGYEYPKTTEVTGYCNTKPYETDESLWQWSLCEDETINFEDLWFAVRGGGGGTFGIVTSLYYQLHDLPGRAQALFAQGPLVDPSIATPMDVEKNLVLTEDYLKFTFRYLFMPETLQNVTELESRSCNAPLLSIAPTNGLMVCHHSAGDKLIDEWKKYLQTSKTKEKYGDDVDFMSSMESLFTIIDDVESQAYLTVLTDGPYAGRQQTDAGVVLFPLNGVGMDHVPLDTMKNSLDDVVSYFIEEVRSGIINTAYLMGGAVPMGSDQIDSLSPLRRNAAFAKSSLAPNSVGLPGMNAELYKKFYELVWRDTDTSDGANFPGILCHNHAGNDAMGPLKTDWTEPCPTILEATQKEREEKCISQADAFWGTENAAHLESIKKDIDPNNLFICNGGIGSLSPYYIPEDTTEPNTGDEATLTYPPELTTPTSTTNNKEGSDSVANEDDTTSSQAVTNFRLGASIASLFLVCLSFI